jgi:ABC-type branched-subunit amino acid transport system substrate-binding protein
MTSPVRTGATIKHGHWRPAAAAGAGLVSLIASLSGCGNSGGNSPVSASSAPAPKFTGATIKVATSAPIRTPIDDLPQIFAGVKAAAQAINKSGGIQGHQVQVITCNGQGDPNTEVACGRNAVAAGVIAMVGELTYANPGGFENALAQAGTADVAPFAFSPPQFSSPTTFPIVFANGEFAACALPALLRTAGTSRVGAVVANAVSYEADLRIVQASARKQGVKFVGSLQTGQTTADFAPLVGGMANKGAGLVVLALDPSESPPFITASASVGKSWSYCNVDGNILDSQLVQLGPAVPKYYQASSFPPLSVAAQYPELRAFMSDMRAEQAAGDSAASLDAATFNTNGLNAWLGMQVVDQVAKTIKGPITHATFLAALKKAKVDLGIVPPIDFGGPIGKGPFPRVFNDYVNLQRWDPAKKEFVLVPGVTTHGLQAMGF